MPNRVTKFLKTSLQNNSETSEDDMYLQDMYLQKIIDNLRLI